MVSYFIIQTGEIPGLDLIRELEYRGGISCGRYIGDGKNIFYYIEPNTNYINTSSVTTFMNSGDWHELIYDKETRTFIEKGIILCPNQEYYVPSGYKLVEAASGLYKLEKIKWKPKTGDTYWICEKEDGIKYHPGAHIWKETDKEEENFDSGLIFETEELCSNICAEINSAITDILKNYSYD